MDFCITLAIANKLNSFYLSEDTRYHSLTFQKWMEPNFNCQLARQQTSIERKFSWKVSRNQTFVFIFFLISSSSPISLKREDAKTSTYYISIFRNYIMTEFDQLANFLHITRYILPILLSTDCRMIYINFCVS